MNDDPDDVDSPAMLAAFGAYAVQRIEQGKPIGTEELLEAFRLAFEAGFDYGRNS